MEHELCMRVYEYLKTILQFMKDSLNGLAYVHGNSLTNLDMKLTNISVRVDS